MNRSASAPDEHRWERVEEICFGAMQREGPERERYLDRHCADDPALRTEVEALVRASETRPDFLARPVVEVTAAPLSSERSEELPAQRIGPYRIVRPLGHGGMGDVWLAVREGDGFSQTVALKVIRRGFDTERVLERFRQERRILSELRHPNIASLVDGGATDDGRPYFVMEFVEGEPIDAYCERGGLGLPERLELLRTVCSAVHHAHQNLVIHRDIKPANILVTSDGVPKLLDFGIGKVLAEEGGEASPVTVVEERALTPEYAAPEQLEGGTVTTATDVFGLGVLLYRLLTGRLPWEPAEGGRLDDRGAGRRDPARPSTVAGGLRLPSEIDAIVLEALRAEPDERYPGPLALADDLARFLAGRPVLARTPSPLYTARKFAARNRAAVTAGALLLIGLVGGTAYTWRQSLRVAAERDKALEVRGFLLETFGAAGPDRATGDPVTARALLDGQAATVMDQYADDPALQAEMMMVLAEGYERLGLFAEAERWAERVVDRPDVLDAAGLASARTLLGWTHHQQGRSTEAEALLATAVDGARAAPGGERMLARALNDLGVVREALGKYEEARAAHEEAMALRVELFGPEHRSVGVSASNLSAIHYRLGDLPAAVATAGQALALLRRSFGPDHQRAIIVQSNLAVFKLVQGDLEGAEADYRELWDRQARLQGAEHPVTVRVMTSLAAVLRQARKWTEAETVLREALRIETGRPEPNPVEVAFAMAALGDVVSADGGRHAEAVRLLQDARALQVEALGAEHVSVAETLGGLSRAYERVDSLAAAVRWQRAAVATLAATLGEEHRQSVSERDRLRTLEERLEAR